MNLLFVGDIVGEPGRHAMRKLLPKLRAAHQVDMVVANGENSAGGAGITLNTANEIFEAGADIITSGDHLWDQKEVNFLLQTESRFIRPANYPAGTLGNGSTVWRKPGLPAVGVLNLQGRTFMAALDNPFHVARNEVKHLRQMTKIIFVDMHAEATSEKIALARMLDGQVSAVVGTHTHVQTADEQIFPGGTAYLSDAGFTGPHESVLGREIAPVIERFVTNTPQKFGVASGRILLQGALIEIDNESGRALGHPAHFRTFIIDDLMPRGSTSQWDFSGELFPPEATRRVFSVAELTGDIRRLLEQHIGNVWVTGEISNCRPQSSGHIYFTLKDAASQLNCIVFRTDALANRTALQDGRKVVLKGEMTVYEPRGQYQMRVTAIELQGVGALQAEFERLKEKLAAEGLFDSARKRPLPAYPQRIGLVTSPTGAAIRDVLHVVQRRNPALEIIFAASAVQGRAAAGEIAGAIDLLNQWSERSPRKLDAILITRGGGSLEDLWAFNEEAVARAVHRSTVPVVSAVGHEIDFTIGDFVADLRAATPSAAAEILTEGVFASSRWLGQLGDHFRELVERRIYAERRHHQQVRQRLQTANPRRLLNQRLQRLDDLQSSLGRGWRQQLQQSRERLRNLQIHLDRVQPARLLLQRRAALEREERRLREALRQQLKQWRRRVETVQGRLQLLGPEQVLARGYSITQDAATGQVIRSSDQTRPGQKLKTRLQNGEVGSVVE